MPQWCNVGKEMYKIARCTCKVVVLLIKTHYFLAVLLAVSFLVGFVVIQKQCYLGNVTSHLSSLFTLCTRAKNFPASVSGTVTWDAQINYCFYFVCLLVFPLPQQQSQKSLRKSGKLPQFLSRFFSGEYEAASVVAMTSSIHKFHHMGFRHFLMISFRRL